MELTDNLFVYIYFILLWEKLNCNHECFFADTMFLHAASELNNAL